MIMFDCYNIYLCNCLRKDIEITKLSGTLMNVIFKTTCKYTIRK